jgi:hypothetical protein
MREICTSGSVRGGGGDAPAYSARDLDDVAGRVEMVVDRVRVSDEAALVAGEPKSTRPSDKDWSNSADSGALDAASRPQCDLNVLGCRTWAAASAHPGNSELPFGAYGPMVQGRNRCSGGSPGRSPQLDWLQL